MARFSGPEHVLIGDGRDALDCNVVHVHAGVERERRENRGLRGGVVPAHVSGRVGLGVAEFLRLAQGLVKAETMGRHLVKDVVRRSVDDPENARDAVSREGFAHRAHERNRTGDGGLEVDVDAGGVRSGVQGRAVLSEKRLVGGHDARAR